MERSTKITKVVIPAAGSGTRLLPVTESLPKEMLPVGRRVTIHHVVQEALDSGIAEVLIVTASKKRAIEEHFDWVMADQRSRSSSQAVSDGSSALAERSLAGQATNQFCFVLQCQPLGLAHAVAMAKPWVGEETFVTSLGDTIIWSGSPGEEQSLLQRMIAAHREHGCCVTIAVEEVSEKDVSRYGIVRPKGEAEEVFAIEGLVEKPPADEAPSRLAIAARYIFEPEIFAAIEETRPDRSGELQVTDSIRILVQRGLPVWGVKLRPNEKRYDIGNFESYYRAYFDFAWNDPEAGPGFRRHVKEMVGTAQPDPGSPRTAKQSRPRLGQEPNRS